MIRQTVSFRIVSTLLFLSYCGSFAGADDRASGDLTIGIRVVDENGHPVSDVRVGRGATSATSKIGIESAWRFYVPSVKTDSKGVATLRIGAFSGESMLLYALHEQRRLATFAEVSRDDVEQPIELTVHVACHVRGQLQSTDFRQVGRDVDWTNVYLHRGEHRPLSCNSRNGTFEFYVPPGRYELQAYGTDLLALRHQIEIEPGQVELEVEPLDLQAEPFVHLLGKPAPELQGIKAWKNGKAVTLEQLRGRVVILDFWGYWCGPCLREMPGLMSLHDDFHSQGLTVIGVHDDSVSDIAEMDENLRFARERTWWGRDIPFLVALDGGGPDNISRTEIETKGATTAAYGVTGFPTAFLIDQNGRLIGKFHPRSQESIGELRHLLGLKPDYAPAWMKRFEAHYQLDSKRSLRHVAPPFTPERTQYITRCYTRRGVGEYPPRITIFQSDRDLKDGPTGQATLSGVLRALADYGEPDDIFDCPRELADIEIPGDWVAREGSSLRARLEALEGILSDELEKNISIEPGGARKEVVVVTGRYEFEPFRDVNNKNTICITADPTDCNTVFGGGSGDFGKFLGLLSRILQRRVIDESQEQPDGRLSWRQCESAVYDFKQDSPSRLQNVLTNLTRQTSLAFATDLREVDVWQIRLRQEQLDVP